MASSPVSHVFHFKIGLVGVGEGGKLFTLGVEKGAVAFAVPVTLPASYWRDPADYQTMQATYLQYASPNSKSK